MRSRGVDGTLKQDIRPTSLQPVNGQSVCAYAKIPFGWFHIGYNGCILLSIYNALILGGYEPDFMQIRKLLHRVWKPRVFGVRAWEIARCLKKLKVPFRRVSSGEEVTSAMRSGDVAIILSWNRSVPFCHFTVGKEPLSVIRFPDPFGGAHGVAVTLTDQGKWRVFNRYSNRDTIYEFSDFESLCPFPALFMKGFIIEPSP